METKRYIEIIKRVNIVYVYVNQVAPCHARSGHSTPTANMFNSLRSSSSVPDLTNSEDLEVSNISHQSQFYEASSCSNPSSRSSSTIGIEVFKTI